MDEDDELSERCEMHRVAAEVAYQAAEKYRQELTQFCQDIRDALGIPFTNKEAILEFLRNEDWT